MIVGYDIFPPKKKVKKGKSNKRDIENLKKTCRKKDPQRKQRKRIYDHGTPGFGSDLTEGKEDAEAVEKNQGGRMASGNLIRLRICGSTRGRSTRIVGGRSCRRARSQEPTGRQGWDLSALSRSRAGLYI